MKKTLIPEIFVLVVQLFLNVSLYENIPKVSQYSFFWFVEESMGLFRFVFVLWLLTFLVLRINENMYGFPFVLV